MLQFHESLIAFDLQANDAHEVIDVLAECMHAKGFVSADYGAQTWAREMIHPTGLPTKPFCIAFPHADAEGVHQSALALATMKSPVTFKNMGDPDEDLQVLMVLMLANRDPVEQVHTLRNLAVLFGKPEKLQTLRDQSTPQAAVAWLRRELRLDEAA